MRILLLLTSLFLLLSHSLLGQSDIYLNVPIGNVSNAAAISFDEQYIVGSNDDKLLLYDFATGTFLSHHWSVPNNSAIQSLVMLSEEYVIVKAENSLWRVSVFDATDFFQFEAVSSRVEEMKVSRDGSMVAIISAQGQSVQVLDAYEGYLIFGFRKGSSPEGFIRAVEFSKDDKSLLVARNEVIEEWNIRRAKLRDSFQIRGAQHIKSVPRTKYFLTSNASKDISIHTSKSTKNVTLLASPQFVTVDESRNNIITADASFLYAFDLTGRMLQKQPHSMGKDITMMDLTLGGWMLLRDNMGAFSFLDMYAMKIEPSAQFPWRKSLLKSGYIDQNEGFFIMEAKEKAYRLKLTDQTINDGFKKLEPEYTFLPHSTSIEILRAIDEVPVRNFEVKQGSMTAWAARPDLSTVFITDSEKNLYTFDVESRRLLGNLQPLKKQVVEMEFLEPVDLLALRNEDGVSFVNAEGREFSIDIEYAIKEILFSQNTLSGVLVGQKSLGKTAITILTYSQVAKAFRAVHTFHLESNIDEVTLTPDGDFVLISEEHGPIHIYDVDQNMVVAKVQMMSDESDYVVWTSRGLYDATKADYVKYLYVVENNKAVALVGRSRLKKVDGLLDNIFEAMEVVEPKHFSPPLLEPIDFRPVSFVEPERGSTSSSERVKITLKLNPRFEDVEKVNVFHNEIIASQVPIQRFAADENDEFFYTFDLALTEGMNTVTAKTALISKRNQRDDTIHLIKNGIARNAGTLHVLGVAVEDYTQAEKSVSAAILEVENVVELFQKKQSGVFGKVSVSMLQQDNASYQAIMKRLSEIGNSLRKDDVVVVVLVGAGGNDLDEGLYFMPSDEKEKVSVREMTRVLPTKDVFVIMDIEEYKFRELNDLESTMLLEQSLYLMVNDRKKHQDFAVGLMNGLEGKADKGIRDGIITGRELRSYVRFQLPEKSTLFISRGADFPLVGTVVN